MIPIKAESPTINAPPVTWLLIGANAAAFAAQLAIPEVGQTDFNDTFALVPAFLADPGTAADPGYRPGDFLPLLTSSFMHAGVLHLGLNMWVLWLFGGPLEDRLGPWRFLSLYLISGVAGGLLHVAANLESMVPTLGASGAVAGILGAYSLAFPRAKVTVVQPIFFFPLVFQLPAAIYTALWLGIQVLRGLAELGDGGATTGGIAWWAHIGGFAAGLGLGAVMGGRRGSRWEDRYDEVINRHPPLTRRPRPR
jgi:membrane associated rhomboid family serine protease